MLVVRRNDMSVEARQYVQPELETEEVVRERPSVAELQRALSDAFAPSPPEARLLPLPGEPADERLVNSFRGLPAMSPWLPAL